MSTCKLSLLELCEQDGHPVYARFLLLLPHYCSFCVCQQAVVSQLPTKRVLSNAALGEWEASCLPLPHKEKVPSLTK